ncbi:uncharacterized protein [Amphiura filiformis]|uniref:uncharacterized protein n=1 Tax=Amphiura filiformis TaxID=82378 RepID=UPI003B21B5F7
MACDDMDNLDMYISYHDSDKELMLYLFDRLEKNDMKVWARDKENCEGSKGTAIINAKIFLVIMSPASMGQGGCSDEVSLAYISDKPIFPVATKEYDEMKTSLNFSMKLILSKINWVFFTSEKDYKTTFPSVLSSVTETIANIEEGTHVGTADSINDELEKPEEEITKASFRIFSKWRRNTRKYQRKTEKDFWDSQFGSKKSEVSWIEFRKTFLAVYDKFLKKKFTEDRISWLVNVAYGDIFRLNHQITKKMYENFAGKTTDSDPDSFYYKLLEYARGKIAMRGVFNMDSTVRLDAVQSLGCFKNATVVASLIDLLNDKDPNMRAIAAIAIGKTGVKNQRIVGRMLKMLQDDDRLVREAACISLGHMQSEIAVPYLVSVWRKEIISHVRNAAEVALGLINSDQSREALRVVQVLSEEMKDLKDSD